MLNRIDNVKTTSYIKRIFQLQFYFLISAIRFVTEQRHTINLVTNLSKIWTLLTDYWRKKNWSIIEKLLTSLFKKDNFQQIIRNVKIWNICLSLFDKISRNNEPCREKVIMFYRCGRGSTLCVVFYISLNLNQNLYQGNKMEEISNFNE